MLAPRSDNPWPRFVAVLAGAALLLLAPGLLADLRPSAADLQKEIGDFFQEWASARYWWDGLPVYGPLDDAFDRYLDLGFRRQPDQHLAVQINGHPPTAVLVALPLGRLSYPDAQMVWALFCLAITALSLWLLTRELGWAVPAGGWLAVAAGLLLCFPYRQHLHLGQLNLPILLLLTLAWQADRRGRDYAAGLWLGLAVALKIYPAFVAAYFLFRRRWRALLGTLAGAAGATLLTAAVLGPEAYDDYVTQALPALRPSWSGWANLSLTSFWLKLFDPAARERVAPLFPSPELAWGLSLAGAAAVLAVLARETWAAAPPPAADRAFGLTVLGLLLVSPVAWAHYLVLLVLPLALLGPQLPAGGRGRLAFGLLAAVLCLDPQKFWEVGIPGGTAAGVAGPAQTLTVLGYPTYALVGLFLVGWRGTAGCPAVARLPDGTTGRASAAGG